MDSYTYTEISGCNQLVDKVEANVVKTPESWNGTTTEKLEIVKEFLNYHLSELRKEGG